MGKIEGFVGFFLHQNVILLTLPQRPSVSYIVPRPRSLNPSSQPPVSHNIGDCAVRFRNTSSYLRGCMCAKQRLCCSSVEIVQSDEEGDYLRNFEYRGKNVQYVFF